MRAALYIRVSTQEQADEGFSIRAQQTRLIAYCEAQDWEVYEVYIDDGYSAKDTDRPALQRMLADAEERRFDVVLVFKQDRFSRSVKDTYELIERLNACHVGFRSIQEQFDTTTPMGRAMMGLLSVFAQFERETIRERIRTGMEQMVLEGIRPGAPLPFGYDPKTGELIEEEVNILRELRRLYMQGMGFWSVARYLNYRGLYHRGALWSQQYVKYCLENPYYAGMIRWGKDSAMEEITVESNHPTVWTKEEYLQHMRRMKVRSTTAYTKRHYFWFTGVLRCGRCGEAMVGKFYSNKRASGARYEFYAYICSGKNNGNGCRMPVLKQNLIESLVLEYIHRFDVDLEAVSKDAMELRSQLHKAKEEREQLEKELAQILERKKKWQRMCANELITEQELREHLKEEKMLEEDIQRRLSTLNEEAPELPPVLLDLPEMWEQLDDIERNELVIEIFDQIYIDAEDGPSPPKGIMRRAWIQKVKYK